MNNERGYENLLLCLLLVYCGIGGKSKMRVFFIVLEDIEGRWGYYLEILRGICIFLGVLIISYEK
jgi:hypothetical protein